MTLRKHARHRHSRSLRFKTLDGCLLLAADAFDVLEPLSSTEYHFVYQRAARERVDRLTASRRRLRGLLRRTTDMVSGSLLAALNSKTRSPAACR
jgi:hypothetical protein